MMASHPSSAPSALKVTVTPLLTTSTPVLPTQTLTTTIAGHPTTVIAQSFNDRIFVTITQLNKFGVFYQATTAPSPSNPPGRDDDDAAPGSTNVGLPPPLPTTSISKLVGTEPGPAYSALYQLYVAQVASIVKHGNSTDPRPLVVSLALKLNPNAGKEEERQNGGGDWEDEEGEAMLMTSHDERERFLAIIQMVQKCRVW